MKSNARSISLAQSYKCPLEFSSKCTFSSCIGYEPDLDNQLCSAITSENVALAFIKYR